MSIRLSFLIILTATVLMGCSSEEEKKTEKDPGELVKKGNSLVYEKNEEKANETVEALTEDGESEKTEVPVETVSAQPGLGDTEDSFIAEYGVNEGDQSMGRFQEDYLLPMFIDGLNYNMKIQFESSDHPSRTMDEAKEVAKQYIPTDATFVKEYVDGEDLGIPRLVMEYHSEQIAKLFPDFEPAGTFIVIFNYGDNEDDVFGVSIGVGNTP